MTSITLDIPQERYSDFLRAAAAFLDGHVSDPTADDAPTEHVRDWRFSATLHPDSDPEFRLLIDYLRKVKGVAGAVLDYMIDFGGPLDGDALADWLNIDNGRRAVAGSLAHASRFAAEIGRPFPVEWDRETGEYSLPDRYREPLAVARLWTVPPPFIHQVVTPTGQLTFVSEARPALYAVFDGGPSWESGDPMSGFHGLFYDTNALHEFDPYALKADGGYEVFRFAPDVAERRGLVPVDDWADAGTRIEWSHDLMTFPPDRPTHHVEVRTCD